MPENDQVEWKCPRCQRQFMLLEADAPPEICSECRSAAAKSATFKPKLIISRPDGNPAPATLPRPGSPAATPQAVLTRTAFEPPREKFKVPLWAYALLPLFIIVPVVLDGRLLQLIMGPSAEASKPTISHQASVVEPPPLREERRPDDRPWKLVSRFTGDTDYKSPTFRTTSGKWRVRWSVIGAIAIEVVSNDGAVVTTIPKAALQQTCAVSSPAGTYSLRIRPRSKSVRWTVIVEE